VAQVNGYIAGMEAAARKTRDLGSEAEKLAAKRQAFEDLGRPLLAFGAIAAAAVGIAIRKFAEFDSALSNVQAVTQATTEDMALLREAALDAGGKTVFTATEAANALEELGKASFDTKTSIDALDGTLALAASGQLEVARAAEITATTLKQFNLAGTEAGHVADVLSAGAGKALGSVEDLAQALKFVGPVAASMGISLEETTGALALFADQGLIGEQAGTSLRGVLSSLTSPSAEAKKAIHDLGIELYDVNTGAFLGLENTAGELSDAFTKLDDKSRDAALGVIFGNQQVTAARVLFAGGAESIKKYTTEVNDAGYAARVAADRMDNLSGDVEKLGGAFDTALIKSGSGANDVLRELVQGLTFLVDGVGNLPEPVLNAGLAVGAIAAAMALTGGAALIAVPRVAAFKAAVVLAGVSVKGASLAIAGIGGAIGIATILIGAFIAQQADASAASDAYADSLDKSTGAVTEYSRALIAKRLQEKGAFDLVEKAGVTQKELTDALYEGGDAYDALVDKLNNTRNGIGLTTSSAGELIAKISGVNGELEVGRERFNDLKAATSQNSTTIDQFSGKVQTATFDLKSLKDAIEGFGSAQLDVNAATRGFQAAIDDLTDSVAENGQTLDLNTEQGRANSAALDDIAKSTLDLAGATLEQTGSQEAATAAIESGRTALIDALAQLGITGAGAEAYADSLGLIPANISTAIGVTGVDAAINNLTRVQNSWNALLRNPTPTSSQWRAPLKLDGFASGGYTGDIPPSMVAGVVHGREFVNDEESTSKPANRAAMEYMNAGGDMRNYQPASAGSGGWSGASGPVTALVDPSFVRAVKELAAARRMDLDTVGLSAAAGQGAGIQSSLGAK